MVKSWVSHITFPFRASFCKKRVCGTNERLHNNVLVKLFAEKVSSRDIGDVIRLLGPVDFHELFHELNIKDADIEKEEKNADSSHPGQQARAVFNFWIKAEGKEATRKAMLDALERCGNVEDKEILEDIWDGRGKRKQSHS